MKVAAFPRESLPELWRWMEQSPAANFEDSGPHSFESLVAEHARRLDSGEWLFGVWSDDGVLSGAVGFARVAHLGLFRGIIFDRAVHGTGLAYRAVRWVLDWAFLTGAEKITAVYYADNPRIHKFLRKLGAIKEGYLRAHARRNGSAVDMRLVSFFKKGR